MQAQAIDQEISQNGPDCLGPLAGVPIAIKASNSMYHACSPLALEPD